MIFLNFEIIFHRVLIGAMRRPRLMPRSEIKNNPCQMATVAIFHFVYIRRPFGIRFFVVGAPSWLV
jgi:hypothetical protein